MSHPRLLLLDEPSHGLAPVIVDTGFDVISQLNRDEQLTIVVVEQNARRALRLANTAYVLQSGTIDLHRTSQDLAPTSGLQALYLGVEEIRHFHGRVEREGAHCA